MDYRYPKDAEKELLAVKSGLTRSQVTLSQLLFSLKLNTQYMFFSNNKNVFLDVFECVILVPIFYVSKLFK